MSPSLNGVDVPRHQLGVIFDARAFFSELSAILFTPNRTPRTIRTKSDKIQISNLEYISTFPPKDSPPKIEDSLWVENPLAGMLKK